MTDPAGGEARNLDRGRQIRFLVTPTGVRVAYATVGQGPALVVPAAWIGHLEIGWQDPAMRAFFAPIAAWRTVVAYDKPGWGLRPLAGPNRSKPTGGAPGGADHLPRRVELLGLSMGRRVAGLAERHPERVGRLIVYGGFADGHQVASAEVLGAMIELVGRTGARSDMLADISSPTPARRPSALPSCNAVRHRRGCL